MASGFYSRWSSGQERTAEKQLIVDVFTGETRVVLDSSERDIRLSPTGKWYAEIRATQFLHVSDGIKIFETATGKLQLHVNYEAYANSVCFSDDDAYFACSLKMLSRSGVKSGTLPKARLC